MNTYTLPQFVHQCQLDHAITPECKRQIFESQLIERLDVYTELHGHEGCVNCLNFCPDDGRILASGSDDLSVTLWHWQRITEPKLVSFKPGHFMNIFDVKFDPYRADYLVSAAADGQVLQSSADGRILGPLMTHSDGACHQVAFVERDVVLSCGEDGVVLCRDGRMKNIHTLLDTRVYGSDVVGQRTVGREGWIDDVSFLVTRLWCKPCFFYVLIR